MILSLQEAIEIGLSINVPEEIIDDVESFHIIWDEEKETNHLTLLDDSDNVLFESDIDDADTVVALIEELFDLDDEDQEWLDSYGWIEDDNYTLQEAKSEAAKYRKKKAIRDNLHRDGIQLDISDIPSEDSDVEETDPNRARRDSLS